MVLLRGLPHYGRGMIRAGRYNPSPSETVLTGVRLYLCGREEASMGEVDELTDELEWFDVVAEQRRPVWGAWAVLGLLLVSTLVAVVGTVAVS